MKRIHQAAVLTVGAVIGMSGAALGETPFQRQAEPGQWLASELIGSYVYPDAVADSEAIGDVNNVLLDDEGRVIGVIVGVGGFLGIGEKNIAVDFSELSFATPDDNEVRVILGVTQASLENAPEFERNPGETYRLDGDQWTSQSGGAWADGLREMQSEMHEQADAEIAEQEEEEAADAIRDAMTLKTEDLVGHRVYTSLKEDWVGEVGEVLLDDTGKVEAVVVDFGGFLGIGEKPVALALDAFDVKQQKDDPDDYNVYVLVSETQLENAPTYDAESYEANRDAVLVTTKN